VTVAPTNTRATWSDVERELERLFASGEAFETAISERTRIASYDRGHRIGVESERGLTFVGVDAIQACWATFEERGAIRRADVLEPGRSSALMMALFERVRGVRREERDEAYLVLAAQ
jgi:hypothetical protein